ncbi:type II toxin-antitoxin system HicB family antitoxin [Candidatus Bathyarchaeota archaeon]|nr:type II toxin-antitoxin system HicB family antitoxin [Candidatus Bathyarchaeota archaeon]
MKFGVVVEKDEEGYYVASVPELPGCHTQAKTLDEVMKRIKEAIQAYLEAEDVKSVLVRQAGKLDDDYLEKRAANAGVLAILKTIQKS